MKDVLTPPSSLPLLAEIRLANQVVRISAEPVSGRTTAGLDHVTAMRDRQGHEAFCSTSNTGVPCSFTWRTISKICSAGWGPAHGRFVSRGYAASTLSAR